MRIGVFLARYSISGVPLAQIKLARAFAAVGHDVDLVIGYVAPPLTLPEVPGVNLVYLARPKVRGLLSPLRRYFRAAKPDIVFSAEDHLNALTLLAAMMARSRAKVSVSSHVTPFDTYSSKPLSKRWFLKHIMRAVSRRADAMTCVSRDMVDQYRRVFRNPRHVPMYNIVDDPSSRARLAEPVEDPWFSERDLPLVIGAGSLEPWKGFDDLIRAVAELRRRGRAVRLVILGEGSRHAELIALVEELGLESNVKLPGRVENPGKYFARADVFALSSRVEGLPTVLVEAMVAGCTPVATDCPTGPREVLADGRYGYLVPVGDTQAMADGIEQALDRPIPAHLLADAVRPFNEHAVIKRHLELLGLDAGV